MTEPLGARLADGGVEVRFWAPAALAVEVHFAGFAPVELRRTEDVWAGFVAGAGRGDRYRFLVTGPGARGFKRDPRARELELYGYPDCDALVVDPGDYPWHDAGWRAPEPADLVVYQFHTGVFSATDATGRDIRPHRTAKLLDAVQRVPYLAQLGVNAVQPLPVVEFQGEWSLGYNGTDLFSPEMDYCVGPAALPSYLDSVNALLAARGAAPLTIEHLAGQANQLRAFTDVCHLYGLAVIFDVVYNHAGGGLDPQSLDYVDLPADPGPLNNAYFSADGWAGGRVFAFDREQVRRFLTDNAIMFLDEYHADGLRFDEVTVIDAKGGWGFCQQLTAELRARKPQAVLIAEYWGEFRELATLAPPDGMGFTHKYADALRDAVRGAVAGGPTGPVLDALRGSDRTSYHCLENHDLVLDMDDHRAPRIPRLADPADPRSWRARSRSRVATGLLLTAPGIPLLFMGQEFLEDKLWSDSPGRADRLIWWDGAFGADRHMADFLRFVRDLLALRRYLADLTGDDLTAYPPDEASRVIAFRRGNVVVVASFNPQTLYGYRLGLPTAGRWGEAFNSDYYDTFPNPRVTGNGGSVTASLPGLHGYPHSAALTLPANGLLVLTGL